MKCINCKNEVKKISKVSGWCNDCRQKLPDPMKGPRISIQEIQARLKVKCANPIEKDITGENVLDTMF